MNFCTQSCTVVFVPFHFLAFYASELRVDLVFADLLEHIHAVHNRVGNTTHLMPALVGGIMLGTGQESLALNTVPSVLAANVTVDNSQGNPPAHGRRGTAPFLAASSTRQAPGLLLANSAPCIDYSSPSAISTRVLHGAPPAISQLLSSANKVYPHKVV